jgi:hypothetical protein
MELGHAAQEIGVVSEELDTAIAARPILAPTAKRLQRGPRPEAGVAGPIWALGSLNGSRAVRQKRP